MPRLTFEEPLVEPPKGEPTEHRGEVKRDGVVVVLKAATFAVVIALLGAVVLLLTAGGGAEPRAKTPEVPEIETSHVATTTPVEAIIAPEVHSQTTAIVPSMPSTTTPPADTGQPTTAPPPPPANPAPQFVVLGEPCETRGAFAFTERNEPAVCGGRGPTWHRMFR